MGQRIQMRRGNSPDRLAFTPEDGEPLWERDTGSFYVGDGVTAGGILITSGSKIRKTGTQAITSGQNTVAVTFPTAFPSTAWHIVGVAVFNTTDSPPSQIYPTVLKVRTAAGFTYQLNANAPTGNFTLRWTAEQD